MGLNICEGVEGESKGLNDLAGSPRCRNEENFSYYRNSWKRPAFSRSDARSLPIPSGLVQIHAHGERLWRYRRSNFGEMYDLILSIISVFRCDFRDSKEKGGFPFLLPISFRHRTTLYFYYFRLSFLSVAMVTNSPLADLPYLAIVWYTRYPLSWLSFPLCFPSSVVA